MANPHLKRSLTLRDLVLFNVVAVMSLRWLATSAAAGPSALTLWVLAALFFFVPQGLAVSELAARHPEEGGIYFWTKRALGDSHGFVCGWCYWVNNILYYPNLLMSTAVIATFVIGRGESDLVNQWSYVLPATLIMLWFATGLNIVGTGTGKWLQNIGAVATYLPGAALVLLGIYAAFTQHPANPFTLQSLTPDFGNLTELNLWASIAFAFAGLELCAVMAGEVQEPRRTLPRSILIAAPLITVIYLIGTGTVLVLIPQGQINVVSGFLQAILAGARLVGTGALWIAPVAAALYVLGNIGGIGAWLAGPARVAFVIGLDRFFPPAFGKVHPKWGTPYVAILIQSVLATIFICISVLGKGTTVETAYLIVLDTMLLIYFIPFIYLFVSYLLLTGRTPSPSAIGIRRWFTGLAGLLLTVFAMIVATVPPSNTPSVLLFELKVVGGAAGIVLVGCLLYWRAQRGRNISAATI
ncbi:MAG: APC family permease [Gemmatimonadota bacterium]